MKNFIIFFSKKEGTSPLVRLMNNFEDISIVHQIDNLGWEPFDRHNCGAMSLKNMEECLEIIFNKEKIDMERLNKIYNKTSTRALEDFNKQNRCVGFKMRFTHPHKVSSLTFKQFKAFNRPLNKIKGLLRNNFKRMIFEVLRRNEVVVFIAVRQDVFRWALSRYHGDGTGKPGHLQFKIAKGDVTKENLGKIYVNTDRFEKLIQNCETIIENKRLLMTDLENFGIEAYPLFYESFLENKYQYFNRIGNILNIDLSEKNINLALSRGSYFKKVHSNSISDFVYNHQEVSQKFGHKFIQW